jgi:hypothetical protein
MGGSTLTYIHLKRKQVYRFRNVFSLPPPILNFYVKTFPSCIDIHGPTLHSNMMFINLIKGHIKYLKNLCIYFKILLVQEISQNIVFCINIKINPQPRIRNSLLTLILVPQKMYNQKKSLIDILNEVAKKQCVLNKIGFHKIAPAQ